MLNNTVDIEKLKKQRRHPSGIYIILLLQLKPCFLQLNHQKLQLNVLFLQLNIRLLQLNLKID